MRAYKLGISKGQFVAETKLHQKLDHFIKGTYQQGEKGCAVGCAVMSINKLKSIDTNTANHKVLEENLGIPEWLARVQDVIFEGVSLERSKKWPVEFAESINVGADLDKIKVPFIIYVLENNIKIQKQNLLNTEDSKIKKIIKNIIEINKNMIKAYKTDDSEVSKTAYSTAWSVQASAGSAALLTARSAAWSAESAVRSAQSAAYSAAYSSAESAALSVGWSAQSAAYSAAYSAAFEKYADYLLGLIKECK